MQYKRNALTRRTLLVVFFGCLTSACKRTEAQLLASAFSDFECVGSEPVKSPPADSKEPFARQTSISSKSPVGFPKEFLSGTQYVLVPNHPIDIPELATKTLPAKLRSIGAQNIEHPASDKELVNLFVGGPLFRIEFELSGNKYYFVNTQSEDYLLVRLDAPS